MKISFKHFFVLACMLVSLTAQAQIAEYRTAWKPGYWSLGFNFGSSYLSSDVNDKVTGLGGGMTLGKNLYYRQGAIFNLDFRGRLLYAQAYGQDWKRNYGILKNTAVNGTDIERTNYLSGVDSLGYVYNNYRYRTAEGGVELLLGMNRFRERTGVVLNFYGGAGLSAYMTKVNQRGLLNDLYADEYAGIDPNSGKAAICSDLELLLDDTYETRADGFNNGFGKLGIMPYAGVELGYQMSRHFWLGIGHRVAFTGSDKVDGQSYTNANTATGDNDLHHYTNLILQWNINRGTRGLRPEVQIRVPEGKRVTIQDNRYNVRASTKNIRSAADVVVTLNGMNQNFEFRDGAVVVPLFNLNLGTNEVRIRVSNEYGEASDECVVICERNDRFPGNPGNPGGGTGPNQNNNGQAPQVNITNPGNNAQSTRTNQTINATISNVANTRDVNLFVNGIEQTNFSFNRGQFSANVNLVTGNNTIRVTARNNFGNGQDEVTVRYVTNDPPPNNSNVPNVNITRPANDNETVSQASYDFEAMVTNITDRNSITVTFNNENVTNFNFNSGSGRVTLAATLKKGSNSFMVKATNSNGTDSDQTTVRYLSDVVTTPTLPIVEITSPANNSTATQQQIQLKAKTARVPGKQNVFVTINGTPTSNFTFDKVNETITCPVTLKDGANTLTVKGKNADGEDEQTVTVNYSRPKTPPVVTIEQPANNSTSNTATSNLRATVTNITDKAGVTVTQNGRTINFTLSGQTVNAALTLNEGANNIVVKATNTDGSDEASTRVTYNRSLNPPTVTISQPINNSTASSSSGNLTAAITNVSDKSNVTVTQNGRSVNFNYNGQTVSAPLTYVEGANTIVVKATNTDGSDEATTKVTFNRAKNPPSVTITKPANNSSSTTGSDNLVASITNVSDKSGVTVTQNGRSINFTYNGQTVNAPLTLIEGANTITVKATNADGSDEASTKITFNKAKNPPSVSISQPANNSTTKKPGANLVASITNVTDKSSVSVTQNGRSINFTYNGQTVNAPITLAEGANTIVVKATNADGSDEASVKVTLTPEIVTPPPPPPAPVKPTVVINAPKKAGQSVSKSPYTVRATVTGVSDKKNITCTLNGKPVRSFNYNATNGTVSFNADLVAGTNNFEVSATNTAGSANARSNVNYVSTAPALPEVSIESLSQPVTSPMSPNQAKSSLIATTVNVASKSEITVTFDGTAVTDFTWDATTGVIQKTFTFGAGTHTVVVKVTTAKGTDSDTRSVTF